jgi:hypothetical protein
MSAAGKYIQQDVSPAELQPPGTQSLRGVSPFRFHLHRRASQDSSCPGAQGTLAPAPGLREDLAQGIVEIEDVPEVKVLRREKDIGKEENSNEDQYH